jgi:hypothetical protein
LGAEDVSDLQKKSILDFGRAGVVEDAAEFQAQVLEIAAGLARNGVSGKST